MEKTMKKLLLTLFALLAIANTEHAMQKTPVDVISQNVTPLWRAVYNNGKDTDSTSLKLVHELIAQGANPNIELPSSSPMEIAFIRLTQRGLDPVEAQRRIEVLKILLSKGAEPKSKRWNLVTLVNNMPESSHKKELLSILKTHGLSK